VHRKADEGGLPGRSATEENVLARSAASGGQARCVPGRRETSRDLGDTTLDFDDLDKVIEAHEILAVARIQIETVGVGRGRDQEVRKPAARLTSPANDCRNHEPVAPDGRTVELDGLQACFDFLEPCLSPRSLATHSGKVWPSRQLRGSDGGDGHLIG